MTQRLIKQDQIDLIGGSGVFLPAGAMVPFGGTSAPTGFLLCDGTTGLNSVANPEYAALYAAIGTSFGGSGATDFDLPDMRGNVPMGLDNMGGSSRNRVTVPNGDVLGGEFGSETQALTNINQIPQHNHGASHTLVTGTTGSTHTHTVTSTTGYTDYAGSHRHGGTWNSCEGGNGDKEIKTFSGSTNWYTGYAGNHRHLLSGLNATTSGSAHTHNITGNITIDLAGSASPSSFDILQPTMAVQYIISLGA